MLVTQLMCSANTNLQTKPATRLVTESLSCVSEKQLHLVTDWSWLYWINMRNHLYLYIYIYILSDIFYHHAMKFEVTRNISCNIFLYIYSFNNKLRDFFFNLEEKIISILIRAEKPKISIYKSSPKKDNSRQTSNTREEHQYNRVAFLCPINLRKYIYIYIYIL